jgi:hypothetical protein
VGFFSPSAQSQISMIEEKTSKVITPLYHAAFSFGSLVGAMTAFYTIKYIESESLIFSITGSMLILGALIVFKFGLSKKVGRFKENTKIQISKKINTNFWLFNDDELCNYGHNS